MKIIDITDENCWFVLIGCILFEVVVVLVLHYGVAGPFDMIPAITWIPPKKLLKVTQAIYPFST